MKLINRTFRRILLFAAVGLLPTGAACQASAAAQVAELRSRAVAGEAGGASQRLRDIAADPVGGRELRAELNRAIRSESDPAAVRVMLEVLVWSHRFGVHPVDDLVATFDHLLETSEGRQAGILMAGIKFSPPQARARVAPAVAERLMAEPDHVLRLGWLEVLHGAGPQGRAALRAAVGRSRLPESQLLWFRAQLEDWPSEPGLGSVQVPV